MDTDTCKSDFVLANELFYNSSQEEKKMFLHPSLGVACTDQYRISSIRIVQGRTSGEDWYATLLLTYANTTCLVYCVSHTFLFPFTQFNTAKVCICDFSLHFLQWNTAIQYTPVAQV